jgi:hypothetical protein
VRPWAAALVSALAAFGACQTRTAGRPTEPLAADLRRLYAPATEPWERWRRHRGVRLPDGREVDRNQAYRDHPRFVAAARDLLMSPEGDDAPLGAWLLGTVASTRAAEAEQALLEALGRDDPRAVFEAALSLARVGGAASRAPLERIARSAPTPAVREAARWAGEEITRRRPEEGPAIAGAPGAAGPAAGLTLPGAGEASPRGEPPLLPPAFRRGVSWWFEWEAGDDGASSFRRLASLGVTWVSIHTWDPLQRGLHDPDFAPARGRFALRGLPGFVKSAHEAGLAVMLKPHLEMRGYEPTPEEMRVLRGPDEEARRKLLASFETRVAGRPGDHNRVEMKTEADWQRWFQQYEAYLMSYAEAARDTGADAFCVGRELDTTVIRREADWRRIIARVRGVYRGPLTYSANFDTWQSIAFWDALDFIGLSAYFPLSDRPDPSPEDLRAGWDRALAPLEVASRRFDRPVLFTESGFPSVAEAAQAPWRETRQPADVWRQARCYEATLEAVSRRPWIVGTFFWLWERSAEPAFHDSSHAIPGKPAAFVMSRWYRGGDPVKSGARPTPPKHSGG